MTTSAALPSQELSALQHHWLSGGRSRMLRLARIAHCQQILDLGCGWGLTSEELATRGGGHVTALDINEQAIEHLFRAGNPKIKPVEGDAHDLPFPDDSFDLVFTQFAFLWFADCRAVVAEVGRVLQPGGVVVCIEPDFDGMMVQPSSIKLRELWCDALRHNGANPLIGRELVFELRQAGFRADVRFNDRLHDFDPRSLSLVAEMTLTDALHKKLNLVSDAIGSKEMSSGAGSLGVHLPLWMAFAER